MYCCNFSYELGLTHLFTSAAASGVPRGHNTAVFHVGGTRIFRRCASKCSPVAAGCVHHKRTQLRQAFCACGDSFGYICSRSFASVRSLSILHYCCLHYLPVYEASLICARRRKRSFGKFFKPPCRPPKLRTTRLPESLPADVHGYTTSLARHVAGYHVLVLGVLASPDIRRASLVRATWPVRSSCVLVYRAPHQRFGGNEGHDPHILYTLSALQVMALLGELDRVDKDKVCAVGGRIGVAGGGTDLARGSCICTAHPHWCHHYCCPAFNKIRVKFGALGGHRSASDS